MTADGLALPTSRERVLSSAIALAMHLAFFALLVIGVHWQRPVSQSQNVADLWGSLTVPKPSPAPPVIEPPPPRPVPTPPKPKPTPPPAPQVETRQADIALEREKKERRTREERLREEKDKAERAEKAEKTKADARRKEEQQMRDAAAKMEKAKADAAARAAKEQADAQARAAGAAAAQSKALVDKYVSEIQRKIRQYVVVPPGMEGNPVAEFDVTLLPGGDVLDVRRTKSSGNPAYDESIDRAIRRAQPLPISPDPSHFQQFRLLHLTFHPRD